MEDQPVEGITHTIYNTSDCVASKMQTQTEGKICISDTAVTNVVMAWKNPQFYGSISKAILQKNPI